MTKHNAQNERIKRKYFAYLKEVKRYSDESARQLWSVGLRSHQHRRSQLFA